MRHELPVARISNRKSGKAGCTGEELQMKIVNWLLLTCCLTVFTSPPGTLNHTPAMAIFLNPALEDGSLPQGPPPKESSSWLDTLWQAIQDGLKWIWEGILALITPVIDFFSSGLQQAVQEIWDDTVGQAEKAVDDVLQNFRNRSCMGSLLPIGALAGAWVFYRCKRKS
jgi:hypothetical protein